MKLASSVAERVYALVKDAVEEQGVSLWDVRFVKEGASYYLRIFIDKEGGVTIDDCTNVNHAIDPIIDEADPIDHSYYLEVCSPGLERELTRPEHYSAMYGRPVKVKLYRARDGVKEFSGKLKSFDGHTVILEVSGAELAFEKQEISACRLDDLDI